MAGHNHINVLHAYHAEKSNFAPVLWVGDDTTCESSLNSQTVLAAT